MMAAESMAFVRSGQLNEIKLDFWSFDTTGTSVGIVVPMVSPVPPLHLLGQDGQNEVQQGFFFVF